MNKTDIAAQVGKHSFEIAGLGLAPFQFVGVSENRITYPDGTSKAGGSCSYCGTGIALECRVKSADGKFFVVGCDCIAKVGDRGLLQAYKNSPEVRAKVRESRARLDRAKRTEAVQMVADYADALAQLPHPAGWTDRATGRPLTALDTAQWNLRNCGAKGIASTLRWLKMIFSLD